MGIRNQPNKDQNNTTGGKQPRNTLSWFFWLFAAVIIIQGLFYFMGNSAESISYTEFKQNILGTNAVERIVVVNREKAEVYIKKDKRGQGYFSKIDSSDQGPHYTFNIGSVENFENAVQQSQAKLPPEDRIDIEYEQRTDWFSNILAWVLPLIIIIAIWIFIINRVRRSGGIGGTGGRNIFDFGKSGAKKFEKGESHVDFDDVAGLEEVKVEVKEIVDFLKNPERYTKLGAKIPKGVLLIGPPGTGKTLLAKAVAGEASVPFFSISGSEFVEMFVGVGASRVRDLFKTAKENAPAIIFIDEIDAIGRSRGRAISFQSNDEKENTLNQMLAEMDGFKPNQGVIVLAATNRGEILDRALLRPGRFDRQIYLELPTRKERQAIFEVHTEPLKLSDDIDLGTLAAQTPGFSGADIANICNEAALIAARRNKEQVEMKDFMDAADRIIAGLEKKSKIISDREKNIIAHHEAGHATASWFLKYADSLLKVSIVPRGRSLGAAWYLPEENVIYTKDQFMDKLCAALGGRAAEDLIFNKVSSGALDDLERVTKQAYTMITYYGLGEKLGQLSYYDSSGRNEQMIQKPYSEETARMIDEEVKQLVDEAYQRTKDLLKKHRKELETLAKRLLEKEVILKDELEEIFGIRPDASDNGKTEEEAKQKSTKEK
jgi:AFG3 family protein